MTRRSPIRHFLEVGALIVMPDDREHRPEASCRCRPVMYRDMLEPSAIAYVHRSPIISAAITLGNVDRLTRRLDNEEGRR